MIHNPKNKYTKDLNRFYMKKCSTLVIKETQIKTKIKYYFTLSRMTIIIIRKISVGINLEKLVPLWIPNKHTKWGTSLVVKWLKICLAVQGTKVQFLVGELRSWEPSCCNYWSVLSLEFVHGNCLAHISQLESPCATTKTLCATIKTWHTKKKMKNFFLKNSKLFTW